MFAPRTPSLCTAPTRPSRTQTVLHHSPGLGSFLTAWAEASEPWVTWEQIPNGKTKRKRFHANRFHSTEGLVSGPLGSQAGFSLFQELFYIVTDIDVDTDTNVAARVHLFMPGYRVSVPATWTLSGCHASCSWKRPVLSVGKEPTARRTREHIPHAFKAPTSGRSRGLLSPLLFDSTPSQPWAILLLHRTQARFVWWGTRRPQPFPKAPPFLLGHHSPDQPRG